MTNKLYLTIITLTISFVPISAGNRMSLEDVIHAARHQSVKALEARQAFTDRQIVSLFHSLLYGK